MAWAVTKVSQVVISDRREHVYDCVYSGTGYGGGQGNPPTGATGPTLVQLGFANLSDSEMFVECWEAVAGVTGAWVGRVAHYDIPNQQLVVGATAAADISASKYRVKMVGRYGA